MTERLRAALRRACVLLTCLAPVALRAAPPDATLELEALTSTELRERIAAGTTVALVPIGGTEQNGPHMVLGKHNVRARVLAERIAAQLGNAVVAPVIAYVPEGRVDPPEAHMRYPGTLSIPEAAFEGVLEGAARSLCRHGLTTVAFLADHGGYLKSVERVAARLNRSGLRSGSGAACHVDPLPEYYRASQRDHAELLSARGFKADEIGTHAGLADTSLALAVDESLVRKPWLGRVSSAAERPGVSGDPRRASVELGRLGVDRIVEVSVAAIRKHSRGR